MPCYGSWTPAPFSAHLSIEWECTASQIETPICIAAQQLSSSPDDNNNNRSAVFWADQGWYAEWLENTTMLRTSYSHPDVSTHSGEITLPRTVWVLLNRLRTGVVRFRSCLHKWDMTPSAACECGVVDQTIGHVILHCPTHRPPHGLHGPDGSGRQLNGWSTPDPRSSAALQRTRTRSND